MKFTYLLIHYSKDGTPQTSVKEWSTYEELTDLAATENLKLISDKDFPGIIKLVNLQTNLIEYEAFDNELVQEIKKGSYL